ncbi:hypothetical protein K8R20_00520 [bacterium]|nr:hypothetical protein [bacterium]
MKFLFGQGFLILLSVIILYYLFNTTQFSPYLGNGGLNWQNIVVLIFFSANILINLTSMTYIVMSRVFLGKGIGRKLIYKSLQKGVILSFGVTLVVILNFLHILDIYYGIGVLALVLLTLLVI